LKNGQDLSSRNVTIWQGCNNDENVERRFPAVLGGGIDIMDLSDEDLGV
jgi:hypothetical protein